MYNTIEECKNDEKLRYLNDLLHNTNIHGGFVEYKNKGVVGSGVYFVASVAPVSLEGKNLADMQRKIEGDPSSFYPYEFAIKITDENPLVVFDKISEFCRKAEMIKVYFTLENVKVPKEMSASDVENMRIAVANSRNDKISAPMREVVRKDLSKSIKSYNNDVKKDKLANRLSLKFQNKEQELVDFIRENKQVNFERIEESQLTNLVSFLNVIDPTLEYYVGDRISVKTGLEAPKEGEYDPYGYATKNYEYREICFKRADEQIFESAFNHIRYSKQFSNGHDTTVANLSQQGPICTVKIPENYMPLVDSLLVKWNIPYAIDYGYMSETDSRTVPILFLEKDKDVIDNMTTDICNKYAKHSYVHAWDKTCFNDKMKEMDNKRKIFRRNEER